ncbi:MAG: hypothetical protein ABIK92_06585 [Pseudomonadota bacterium]
MKTAEFIETQEIIELKQSETKDKTGIPVKKPAVVKAATVLISVLAALLVIAVLSGKTAAVIFVPILLYCAYGLSELKAPARNISIIFACFGLLVNLGAYAKSDFAMHYIIVDIVFYINILSLLLSPSARGANWIRKN